MTAIFFFDNWAILISSDVIFIEKLCIIKLLSREKFWHRKNLKLFFFKKILLLVLLINIHKYPNTFKLRDEAYKKGFHLIPVLLL